MTEPLDQERGPVAAVVRLFAVQGAAVVGIAAAITLLVVLFGPDDTQVQAGLPAATSSAPEPAQSSASASEKATPTKSKRTKRSPSAQATAPPSPSATTSTSEPSKSDKGPRVDVLNQSAGSGAAEATAELLRDEGWRVGRVDDFRGTVRTTTVYYRDDALQRDARRLARDLPGEVRVLEGFSTLSETRLSVVLVD